MTKIVNEASLNCILLVKTAHSSVNITSTSTVLLLTLPTTCVDYRLSSPHLNDDLALVLRSGAFLAANKTHRTCWSYPTK